MDGPVDMNIPSSLGYSPGTQIHIMYSGSWSGSYTDESSIIQVSGSGEQVINLKNPGSSITGTFTKGEQNSNKMVIEIIREGYIIKKGSTINPTGTVTITVGA
jgi:hypothetical protein